MPVYVYIKMHITPGKEHLDANDSILINDVLHSNSYSTAIVHS